jgi:hypothetical protein
MSSPRAAARAAATVASCHRITNCMRRTFASAQRRAATIGAATRAISCECRPPRHAPLRGPVGAPPLPPCSRQTARPCIAGCRQAPPSDLRRAQQRGARLRSPRLLPQGHTRDLEARGMRLVAVFCGFRPRLPFAAARKAARSSAGGRPGRSMR